MNADQILDEAANTFRQKNKVYGDNYERVGKCLAAMFPNGLFLKTADDHNRFQIYNLILVKLSRYAVNWSKGGHRDSIHDAVVYAAMLEDIDAKIAQKAAPLKFPILTAEQEEKLKVDWGYKSQADLEKRGG